MIYAMQCIETGVIKIGCSDNVERRWKELEAQYGKPLAILSVFPGSFPEEQMWHDRFSHLRIGQTEQFRPAADLMEALGRPLLVGVNPDAVEAIRPLSITVLAMRGTIEFKHWLQRLAEFDRSSMSQLLDRAIVAYAKAIGFNEPPPER